METSNPVNTLKQKARRWNYRRLKKLKNTSTMTTMLDGVLIVVNGHMTAANQMHTTTNAQYADKKPALVQKNV